MSAVRIRQKKDTVKYKDNKAEHSENRSENKVGSEQSVLLRSSTTDDINYKRIYL